MREATRARYLLTPQAVMAKGITLDLAFETRTIRGAKINLANFFASPS
jgi:hypothetical protein